ncbi:VWA domain-containing protein [Pontiellaceae bacterium B12227]|nr:VWA domain-containing protein [Pontiellaceae bacterium B12227]
MTFHFIRPIILLGIPLVVLVWFLWKRAADPLRGWREVMDPDLLSAVVMGNSKSVFGMARLAAWLLAVIAVAGPTWQPEPSPFSDDPSPVMILLKADESMNHEDFSPSRLERARLKVVDFSTIRKGRPTGLIAYAGTAHLVLPPTRDTEVVATMAGHISPEIMPEPGDDLNAAIKLAEKTLKETGGSIVVIADTFPAYDSELPVYTLAVSRTKVKGAVMISPDTADIETLDRKTKGTMIAATAEGKTRWAEAGWWIVPVIALLALFQFRRSSE